MQCLCIKDFDATYGVRVFAVFFPGNRESGSHLNVVNISRQVVDPQVVVECHRDVVIGIVDVVATCTSRPGYKEGNGQINTGYWSLEPSWRKGITCVALYTRTYNLCSFRDETAHAWWACNTRVCGLQNIKCAARDNWSIIDS